MPRIFVDFNKIESMREEFDCIAGKLAEQKDSYAVTLDNLDWEVRSKQRILRRSQSLITKIDALFKEVNGFSCYIQFAMKPEYEKLENYEKIYEEKQNQLRELEEADRKKDEEQAFIDDFESKNPDIKAEFNRFLESGGKNNDLTDDEKREIKYRAYKADDPARKIFLRNLYKLKIKNTNANKKISGYNPGFFAHNIDFVRCKDGMNDAFGGGADDRYDYATVFHESAHAFDDLSEISKKIGTDTENYTAKVDGKEMTVREAIFYDVYDNKANKHSLINYYENNKTVEMGSFEEFKQKVMYGYLNDEERRDYETFLYGDKNDINRSTPGYSRDVLGGVSDVYGGATNNNGINAIAGCAGHPEDDYWNNSFKLSTEAWAHYYEGQFVGDENYLNNMNEYLPTACKVLKSYETELASRAKEINK